MKFYLFVALAALTGAQSTGSTVQCSGCPPASSTVDVVSRSPLPSTSCTQPHLTANSGTAGMAPSMTMSTTVMTTVAPSSTRSSTQSAPTTFVTAGASVKGMSGVLAFAAAVAYLL